MNDHNQGKLDNINDETQDDRTGEQLGEQLGEQHNEQQQLASQMTKKKIIIWAIMHVLITVGLGVWVLFTMDLL